ncbi:MAG: hypothetical protein JOZ71_14200 [Ktedonobacteraceae bacterium]|nr:hypothetical protein [Ktedonobacteraceae bacterium]
MQILRWQEAMPPQEQQLYKRMQQEGLSPYTWANGPGDYYEVHSHSYQKVLYCMKGSIRFIFPKDAILPSMPEFVDLAPGDCLILPARVLHSAQVGPQGVTCMEAAHYDSAKSR